MFSFEGAYLLENMRLRIVYAAGAYDAEVPPVPIPNTEVKLCRAEDTWLVTAWENR